MVLKALNDLKSDMGTVKKILHISDGTKPVDTAYPRQKTGYRVSEQREKTRSRFAGAIAKGPKVKRTSSVPQPLTARKVTITQSDSDSEQPAQFAGIQRQYKPVVPDYRILSAEHNINVLGEKWSEVLATFLRKSAACLCWKRDRVLGLQFQAYRRVNPNSGILSIIVYQLFLVRWLWPADIDIRNWGTR